jgi:hypothetical protein
LSEINQTPFSIPQHHQHPHLSIFSLLDGLFMSNGGRLQHIQAHLVTDASNSSPLLSLYLNATFLSHSDHLSSAQTTRLEITDNLSFSTIFMIRSFSMLLSTFDRLRPISRTLPA